MNFNSFLRFFHKYLNLIVSAQLLIWTISGLFFAYNKASLNVSDYFVFEEDREFVIPNNIAYPELQEINFFYRNNEIIYKIKNLNGESYFNLEGKRVKKLSLIEAEEILENKTNLFSLESIEIIEGSNGSEYRNLKLPVYKILSVNSDGEEVNAYMDPLSGKILALRTNKWRQWDFLWGLHIMDWTERNRVDNFFLKFFTILALFSSISGLLLFFSFNKKKFKK